MKKSSLGRRSTLGVSRVSSIGGDSMRREKVSGIPVKVRPGSSDVCASTAKVRPTPKQTPCASTSKVRPTPRQTPSNHLQPTPSAQLTTGTLRPSRVMTMSTDSARLSSLGGVSKKDPRPLQDKEWQASVERDLFNFFNMHGSGLLSSGNIRQMSLNIFIEVLDFLFKKLDPSLEINKVNYKQELPFLLKKMHYNGKIDKSLLSTVNAPHTWPYSLGILQFILENVEGCFSVDPMEMMYPKGFGMDDNCDRDDFTWDFTKLLPFLLRCYELKHANVPDYKEQVNALSGQLIKEHFPEDLSQLVEKERAFVDKLQEEVQSMDREVEQINIDFCKDMLKNLESDLLKEREYVGQLEAYIQNMNSKVRGLDMEYDQLKERLAKLKKVRDQLKEELRTVQGLNEENELREQKRNSLLRETEVLNKYVEEYSTLVYTHDKEIMVLKKKLDETLFHYNMLITNTIELEPEFESLKIENNPMLMDMQAFSENVVRVLDKLKIRYTDAVETVKKEISQIEESIIQVEKTLTRLQKSEAEQNSKLKKLQKKYEVIKKDNEKKIEEHQSEVDGLNNKCDKADQTIERCKSQLVQIQEELEEKVDKKKRMNKEYEVIEQQVRDYMNNVLEMVTECNQQMRNAKSKLDKIIKNLPIIEGRVYLLFEGTELQVPSRTLPPCGEVRDPSPTV